MQSTPFRVRHGIIVETSNNTSTTIVANNQVLTGSASNALVDLATTWNTTGNPTALKLNVTNTASGASSALMDLQVGGVSRFKVAANGNIGIGTSSPTSKLHLANNTSNEIQVEITSPSNYGSAALTFKNDIGVSAGWALMNSTRNNYGVITANNLTAYTASVAGISMMVDAAGPITFAAGGPAERMRIDSTGNIGIGIISPTAKLTVANSTSATSAHIYGTYTDGSNYERINLTANSTASYIQSQQAGTGTARSLFLGANNATHMAVAANGNIGIGTTAPTQRLTLIGPSFGIPQTSATTQTHGAFRIASPGTTGILDFGIGASGTNQWIQSGDTNLAYSYSLLLNPNGGNVGIGTTTPAYPLQVRRAGGAGSLGITVDNVFSGLDRTIKYLSVGDSGTDTSGHAFYSRNGSTTDIGALYITPSGNVSIGTTSASAKLHVLGTSLFRSTGAAITLDSASATDARMEFLYNGTRSGYISVDNSTFSLTANSAAALILGANAQEHMRVAANGNIGIGVTSPSSALDVNGKITTRSGGALRGYFGAPSWDTSYISMQHALLTESASSAAIHQSSAGDTTLNAAVGRSLLLRINNDSGGQGQLEFTNRKFVFSVSNVAIGMTAPTAKFTVADGTTPTSQHNYGTYTDGSNYERINFTANSTGHYVLSEEAGTGTARSLFLGANNATMVTVAANGNIGIGTTAPSYKLDVVGTVRVKNGTLGYILGPSGELLAGEDSGGYYFAQGFGVNPAIPISYGSTGTTYQRWYANGSERMRLTSAGNFGIGIVSPARKLDVYGSGQFSDASGIQTTIWSEATSGTGGVGTNNNYPFTFLTNGSERVRITTAGNVGIGNTAPIHKLRVEGDLSVSSNTTISGNVIIDNALTITQSSLTASANITTTSIVSTNELVLSNTNVAALHRSPNAITALNIYDTSKDSDGGAWTEKCQGASWYNEPLAGKWLGSCTSEGAARLTGGPVGAEQVVDGTFASGTANWTLQLSATLTAAAGELTVTSAGNNSLAYQFLPISALAPIRITIRLVRGAGYIAIGNQGYSLNVGDNVFNIPAGLRTNSKLDLAPNVGTTAVFSNVSVKEVTALTTASNDYFQLSTDGKFYRLYKNLLKASGDVTNSIWSKSAATILSGQTALDGSTTAFKLVENTANSGHDLLQTNLVYFTNTFYATTVYAKASGRTKFRIQIQNNGGNAAQWEFDLTAVTATNTYGTWTGHGATITDVGSGWYRCTLYGQSPNTAGTHALVVFQLSNGTNSYTGDGTSGVLFWRPQVELSNAFTSYEETSATWEIFRGNKADFPRLVAIVVEGGVVGGNSITIYDLTESGRPMWMRFFGDGANYTYEFLQPFPITSFAILNGVLAIGVSYADLAYYGHLRLVDFPADTLKVYDGYYGTGAEWLSGISRRQEDTTIRTIPITTPYYPSGDIRAIAMTVLPDAPMDPVTGLKVPTIALATGAGVSIIKHNGTAVTMTHQNYKTTSVTFLENEKIAWGADAGGNSYASYFHINKIPSVTTDYGPYYNPSAGLEFYASRSWGGGSPTIRFADSDSYMVKTVLANQKNKVLLFSNYYSTKVHGVQRRPRATGTGGSFTIAPTYNTGWMAGDIRRAYLSDTSIDSAVGGELLSNPNFNSDLSSWTVNQATSWVSGAMRLQSNGSPDPNSYSEIITVKPGTVYEIVMTLFGSDTIARTTYIRLSPGGTASGAIDPYVGDPGQAVNSGITTVRRTLTLIPAGVTQVRVSASLSIGAGVSGAKLDVLDVSVREVVPDRSYKTASAAVNGTISRAKVANNTSLVGYSGFSTSNYLREPYSADLDFGTGEWNASAWVNIPVTLPLANFPAIGSNVIVNGTFAADTNWTKGTGWTISGGVATHTGAPLGNLEQSVLTVGVAYRITMNVSGGVVNIYAGGAAYMLNLTGAVDVILIATATQVYIQCSVDGVTVDNVSYVPVSSAIIAAREFSSGPRIRLGITGTGLLTAEAYDGTTTRTVTTTGAYNIAQWMKAEANYTTDGSLAIRVNGREVAVTRGAPLLTLNNASAVLTIGNNYAADGPFPGSIALIKLGATVPTYEQSQFMYDQEKQLFRANALSVLPDTGAIVDMAYDDATDRWAAVSATNESYWNGLIRNSVTASPAGSYTKISTTSGVELASRSTTNPGVDVSIPAYGLREELVKRSESAARLTKELIVLDYVGGFTASTTNGSTAITSVNLLTYPTSYIGAVISGSGIPANTTIVAVSGTTIYLSAAATATAAGVTISFLDFKLPVGIESKTVMVAGAVKQEGSTKDYTRLYDGFIETIRFGAAPGTAAWVQIQAAKGSV